MASTRSLAIGLAALLLSAPLLACSGGEEELPIGEVERPTPAEPTPTVPAAARLVSGTVLIGDNGGRVLAFDPTSGELSVVTDGPRSTAADGEDLLEDTFGIAIEPDGHLLTINRAEPSRLVRIDPATGAQTLLASDPSMHYGLTALTVARDGTIYFGDEEVTDPDYNSSAVYRADPSTGALSIVTTNRRSVEAGGVHQLLAPLGLAVASDGTLWVLADVGCEEGVAEAAEDCVGAILEVDPGTGRQVVRSSNHRSTTAGGAALFHDPRAFTRMATGDFFVVDNPALNMSGYDGDDAEVIFVDHVTGAQRLVSDNAASADAGGDRLFERPYGIALGSDGSLYVGDGDRLLRVDPDTGAQSLVATGLGSAISVAVVP